MSSERQRIWEHRLHEDHVFSDRQNYFLLAESMLAIAFTVGVDKPFVATVVSAAAMVITAGWLYVNRRQMLLVRHVHDRAIEQLPEFAAAYETRPICRVTSSALLGYVMPVLLATMWALLLLAVAAGWR
jgi:hypothetical protein